MAIVLGIVLILQGIMHINGVTAAGVWQRTIIHTDFDLGTGIILPDIIGTNLLEVPKSSAVKCTIPVVDDFLIHLIK